MYETFFGFSDRPFPPAPQAKHYFRSSAAEAARLALARCIERGEGIGLMIGPAGTGKSLLCHLLAEQYRSRLAVASLANGRISTRRNLYQAILFELGIAYRGLEEGELRLILIDHMTNKEPIQGGLLLLIDEAHALPLRQLEELRLLTNLSRNGQPRVRLVVSGGPGLEERLASPKLESFNQRIAARCYLQSFNYDETLGYVRGQIANVGGKPERVFAGDALDAIYRASDGIPRLINQIGDHALVRAFSTGSRQVSAAGIEEAWADLQQLPMPWNAAPGAPETTPDIIEFGALDEVEPAPAKKSVEKPIAAKLHAAPEKEDVELFEGDFADRLEQIGAKLGALDRSVATIPAADPQIGPGRSSGTDPFSERFVEEEVVVDRLARLENNLLANRPLVRSAEGRELSALLERHEAGNGRELREEDDDASDRVQATPMRPADDPVLPEEPSTVSILIGASIEDDSGQMVSDRSLPPLDRSDDGSAEDTENLSHADEGPAVWADDEDPDLDLIVVEDDPIDPDSSPSSAPQREGFRQLFTRLRRG